MGIGDLSQGAKIAGPAADVNRHDRPRARRDRCFCGGGIGQPRTSLQVDLSFAYRSDDRYALGRVDYVFWLPTIASAGWGDLRWYVGPGLYVGVPMGLYYSVRGNFRERGFFLGAEAAVGIGAAFKFPIEVMVEVAPRLQIADDEGLFLGLSFSGAIHVRYYL